MRDFPQPDQTEPARLLTLFKFKEKTRNEKEIA